MTTTGTITDIRVCCSITRVTLETDGGELRLATETNLLLPALADAFGGDWIGQRISFEHDGIAMSHFEVE